MNCDGLIARGINSSCEPHPAGYERRAVIINREDIEEITYATGKKNIISGITLKRGKTGYLIRQNGKAFNGTKTDAVVGDYGNSWTKTVQFVSVEVGSEAAEDLYDALLNGEFLIILENKDKGEDGAFEAIGAEAGLKLATGAKDNSLVGQRWTFTLTEETCQNSEIVFYNTSYSATKTAFEALLPQEEVSSGGTE